jgi:hypothetical protein
VKAKGKREGKGMERMRRGRKEGRIRRYEGMREGRKEGTISKV